jgi:spermidine synthase
MIPGDENLFIAAKSKPADSLNPELLTQRWQERKLQTRFITPFQIQNKLQAGKQKWLEESLARGKSPKLNRDEQPVGLYYGLSFWNAQFHPGFQKIWEKIENLRLWHFALLGLILFGIFSFWLRRERSMEKVILWTVGTTGFYSISLTLVLIFSFQTLYGYVYQWLGLLIAAFMSGLAAGGFIATRSIGKGVPWRKVFVALEGSIVLFLILVFFLVSRFYEVGGDERGFATVQIIFLLGSIVTGVTVGLEFSLAGLFFANGQGKIGEISGILYAADLIGAWAGALIAGVILVPVLGIQQTILGIGLLKLSSLVWLFWRAIIKKDPFPI